MSGSRNSGRRLRALAFLQACVLVVSLVAPVAALAADPSASPSPAPSSSPAPSPDPSAAPSPSPDPSAAPSPSPDVSPAPSDSPAPSPSDTPAPSPDASPAPSPSASPDASPSPSPDASPAPSDSPSPSPSDAASPSPDPSPSPSPSPAPTRPYIVTFAAGISASAQAASLTAAGATDDGAIPALRMHAVRASDAAVVLLNADTSVARVEVDTSRSAEASPSDPSYPTQWSLPKIGWDQAFGTVTPTGSAIVAILDTGVDADHPELAGVVLPGTSILDGSDGRSDPNGHGTWMAGIVAVRVAAA